MISSIAFKSRPISGFVPVSSYATASTTSPLSTYPTSFCSATKRFYANPVAKKKARVNVHEKFPREFKKYNVYGLRTEESGRPRPPMNFIFPKIPKEFYKLRYFIFQLARCRLTYDWESALQIARNIQRYEGEKGMPKKVNPVVFNWICITLIRCGRPIEAIEIWRASSTEFQSPYAYKKKGDKF